MLAEYFPFGDVLATGLVMEYSPLYPLPNFCYKVIRVAIEVNILDLSGI